MKKKRKKTLYICTQTRDILPSCPVGGVHTCSVVSFLSHHLTWWKVRLMKKKSCFIWEKRWRSITFGYKYSSIKWTTYHHRFTVIAIIVALEGWQKGGGVDLSYRKSGAQKARQEVVAVSEGRGWITIKLAALWSFSARCVATEIMWVQGCRDLQTVHHNHFHIVYDTVGVKITIKRTSMKVLNPSCQTLCLHDVCSSIGSTRRSPQ